MAGDRFGVAVGITEGYAVVGAEWHTGPGGTGCGAAYVFALNGSWTQEAMKAFRHMSVNVMDWHVSTCAYCKR